MNLDELQSVQARERQSSDLQHLRSSFYREVGAYIDELTDRRADLVAEVDDPFSSPEVRQLSDDIETAEQTVEAIYERRVGKVVKKASIAAAGMPVDDDGLTAEEEALFEDLVGRIERNRETVLAVLDGEPPASPGDADAAAETDDVGAPGPVTGGDAAVDPADRPPVPRGESAAVPDEPVDAADLMGTGGRTPEDESETGAGKRTGHDGLGDGPVAGDEHDAGGTADVENADGPREVPPRDDTPGQSAVDEPDQAAADDADAHQEPPPATDPDGGGGDVPGLPRTTVRITADVGEVVGADDRDYDLSREDVVTLPEPNADVLVEKDVAERVE